MVPEVDGPAKRGSIEEFRANWRGRRESAYNHWSPGSPKNQIQLAFSYHWEVFSDLLGQRQSQRVLEVGSGRGSLSSHFAAHGWHPTLLDTSPEVLDIARHIFSRNGHSARFVVGDADNLPFEEQLFDVVASIGLLEHFEDASTTIDEQWRVLAPGGWLFCYIVPERPDNLQRYFNWINKILKFTVGLASSSKGAIAKQEIYRSDSGSEVYLPLVAKHSPARLFVSGMYSMPMISHSPDFPFSLLPAPLERLLVVTFKAAVWVRGRLTGRHGWLCQECNGQAFLVAAQKGD